MRGRPAVPTALKVARGNPGKRPINKNEPKPTSVEPIMPDDLDDEAVAEWQRLVPMLLRTKVLTEVDGAALAQLCRSVSRQRKCESEFISGGGSMTIKGAHGGKVANPLVAMINREVDAQHKLLQQFGMTPAARTKVQVVSGSAESSSWDEIDALGDERVQ